MIMKTGINILLPVFLALLMLGCTSLPDNDNEQEPQQKGEPVELSFKLYEVSLTKALGATSLVDLEPGTKFTVLAYKAGTAVDKSTGKLPEPLGKSVCTIANDKTADGNMSLYRGEYDLYFISYNSETAPAPNAGEITVNNGYDFMYNEIKGLVVQPQDDGENKMEVSMAGPFVRLGSKIELSVKAKESPVKISDLKVQKIEIKNLSAPLTYYLGEKDWRPDSDYKGSYTVSNFSYTVNAWSKPHTNIDPVVLLPVNGSEPLEFIITLKVFYTEEGVAGTQEGIFTYTATTSKALLKGMQYKFEFTLTFFGILNPGDITISLLDYTKVDQSTDEVGE
jgi:hypothetical protein